MWEQTFVSFLLWRKGGVRVCWQESWTKPPFPQGLAQAERGSQVGFLGVLQGSTDQSW